ncbi:MAG: cytochrome C oxidase subunit IV family protein [Pseudomonadota bacterium]
MSSSAWRPLLREPSTWVWAVLMAATIVSTWGFSQHGVPARLGTVGVFLLAAFKVRLVLLHFMALRHAPLLPRLAFEAWLLVVTAVILVAYLQPIQCGAEQADPALSVWSVEGAAAHAGPVQKQQFGSAGDVCRLIVW